jgi:thioredoxin reductase (NADPH)
MKYDVIIIGAGPIGLAAGIEAKKRNLSHLIIEKGCIVNSIYHYPTNMVFFSTSERLEIGGVPFISHGNKPTRREALEYYRRVASSWKLNIHTYEKVEKVHSLNDGFKLSTDKSNYQADNVIVSTGFFDYPNSMDVKGEELEKVKHYYDEPHPYAYQKVLVVGGGNSGVDVALETFRAGAEVTLVLNKDKLEDNVKYWVRPDIENRIKEGSIKAYYNSNVKEIREKEVDILTPNGLVTLENDFVLAMTGYQPDFDFLNKVGIDLTEGNKRIPYHNEETFETNIKGIYLAGVVCGGMDTGRWFIENSRYHVQNIFDNIEKNS